jgi:FdhD protein
MEPAAPERTTSSVRVRAISPAGAGERLESLVGEEPFEIRACGPGEEPVSVAVTMRTPGDEVELAVGFLISEGLVAPGEALSATFGDPGRIAQPENEVTIHLERPFDPAAIATRNFVATASCGICGRASLDGLAARCDPLPPGPRVSRSVIVALPGVMRSAQEVFERTGGLHAAAVFDARGSLVALREDVGRHNAVDKVVGRLALDGALPLHDRLMLVSGRLSFEIVQKAAVAGVPILVAVSAPSDLAVETARRARMTLIGFLRGDSFNVYTGEERLDIAS